MINIKILSGGLTLASGDAIVIKQEAGNGNTWSYTATADLIITSYSLIGSNIFVGTWVSSASGVNAFLPKSESTPSNQTRLNKLVIKSGETLTANDVDVDTNGLYLGGFEL